MLIRWFNFKSTIICGDTSRFSVVQNINSATTDLNSDFSKISDCAFSKKMDFNPDPNKQA